MGYAEGPTTRSAPRRICTWSDSGELWVKSAMRWCDGAAVYAAKSVRWGFAVGPVVRISYGGSCLLDRNGSSG